jgi:hypothetical protein
MKNLSRIDIQINIARILIIVGLSLFIYRTATYSAYQRCDGRYRILIDNLAEEIDFREYLKSKDAEGDYYARVFYFHPCGYMYSGYNLLLVHLGASILFLSAGILTYLQAVVYGRKKV